MKVPKKVRKEASGGGAPAYIVTFSDMITLLLTFFVLLLAMADEQNEALFREGQSSFKRALAGFGMSGIMFNRSDGSQFEHPLVKYRVKKGNDETEDRSIDAETEMMRRVIMDLEDLMEISPSHITASSKTFTATDIRFKPGSWILNEPDKEFLTKYIRQIRESFADQPLAFYVVGLAESESSERQQWIVSGNRAMVVADFLKDRLSDTDWPVYSWGVGSGGDWAGSMGLISKKAQIMIVMLIENKSYNSLE
jgi:chemotaxis protein MotB